MVVSLFCSPHSEESSSRWDDTRAAGRSAAAAIAFSSRQKRGKQRIVAGNSISAAAISQAARASAHNAGRGGGGGVRMGASRRLHATAVFSCQSVPRESIVPSPPSPGSGRRPASGAASGAVLVCGRHQHSAAQLRPASGNCPSNLLDLAASRAESCSGQSSKVKHSLIMERDSGSSRAAARRLRDGNQTVITRRQRELFAKGPLASRIRATCLFLQPINKEESAPIRASNYHALARSAAHKHNKGQCVATLSETAQPERTSSRL